MPHDSERAVQIHQATDLLIRSSRLHHRVIEKCFDNTGLHRSQRRMLMHLSRFETMPSQRRIADDFEISPACVARTLKALANEGYITRAGDEDDLRRNNVSITEKGLSTVSETRNTFDRLDQAAFEGFSGEELEQLISLLGRVKDNLSRSEEIDISTHNPMKGSVSH